MYVEDPRQKEREKKIDNFLTEKNYEAEEEQLLEAPHDFYLAEHSEDVLTHWQAPEFEYFERDKKWYLYITLALLAIISWAVFTNSPVMAITFILIGIVGYIHINREPEIIDFMITYDGIVVGHNELYHFDDLRSFWIFYEPEGKKVISLHTKSTLIPYLHIPIHEENPVHIREILLKFLPEEKHQEGIVELLERILGF